MNKGDHYLVRGRYAQFRLLLQVIERSEYKEKVKWKYKKSRAREMMAKAYLFSSSIWGIGMGFSNEILWWNKESL